jgi:hypothetical protein
MLLVEPMLVGLDVCDLSGVDDCGWRWSVDLLLDRTRNLDERTGNDHCHEAGWTLPLLEALRANWVWGKMLARNWRRSDMYM